MIFNKKLLQSLDEMLDKAITGTFQAQSYNESQLSKIESKMVRFIDQSQLRREQIEGERERVRSLISDISHQTKTPLADLVAVAIAECESLASAKMINLSAAHDDAPITALIDSRWCGEALFNIIENAVKYTPENGRVTVAVTDYEMFVRIDVSDTGRGIREEDLPKVFGRF